MSRSVQVDALIEPIELLLLPLGFVGGPWFDEPPMIVSAMWWSPLVLVRVAFEEFEAFGQVHLGRRWPDMEPRDQPYWSAVHLQSIEARRGLPKLVGQLGGDDLVDPERIRDWARQAAGHLAALPDLLQGEGLELVDELIKALPREGVPGLDFPE